MGGWKSLRFNLEIISNFTNTVDPIKNPSY